MPCNPVITTPAGLKMQCHSYLPIKNGINYHECVLNSCSHSKNLPHLLPLHTLISKVVITKDCSSDMMKSIDKYTINPSIYQIDGIWKKITIN